MADLPEGMEGLPKFSAEDVAEAERQTKDKYTNMSGVTDVSQMGGKVRGPEDASLAQERFRQKAMEGVRTTAPLTPAPVLPAETPHSEDGGTVPKDKYLDAKKEWKAEQAKLQLGLEDAQKRISQMGEFMLTQQQNAPVHEAPPPEEEDISFDPIVDEDGNEDPRFKKLMDQIDRRDRIIYGRIAKQQQHELNAVKSASAKQAVNSMLDGFFRKTGINPGSETGKFSKEGIVSLITALPVNMKERAADIWLDRMEKTRSEILTNDAQLAQKKKEEVKGKHGTETSGGKAAGDIPAEYLDKRIPGKVRAKRWLEHQEAMRKR